MDINQQLQPIITGIIQDLKTQINAELRQQLSSEIVKTLAATELTSIINQAVTNQVKVVAIKAAKTGSNPSKKCIKVFILRFVLRSYTNNKFKKQANKKIPTFQLGFSL